VCCVVLVVCLCVWPVSLLSEIYRIEFCFTSAHPVGVVSRGGDISKGLTKIILPPGTSWSRLGLGLGLTP